MNWMAKKNLCTSDMHSLLHLNAVRWSAVIVPFRTVCRTNVPLYRRISHTAYTVSLKLGWGKISFLYSSRLLVAPYSVSSEYTLRQQHTVRNGNCLIGKLERANKKLNVQKRRSICLVCCKHHQNFRAWSINQSGFVRPMWSLYGWLLRRRRRARWWIKMGKNKHGNGDRKETL